MQCLLIFWLPRFKLPHLNLVQPYLCVCALSGFLTSSGICHPDFCQCDCTPTASSGNPRSDENMIVIDEDSNIMYYYFSIITCITPTPGSLRSCLDSLKHCEEGTFFNTITQVFRPKSSFRSTEQTWVFFSINTAKFSRPIIFMSKAHKSPLFSPPIKERIWITIS